MSGFCPDCGNTECICMEVEEAASESAGAAIPPVINDVLAAAAAESAAWDLIETVIPGGEAWDEWNRRHDAAHVALRNYQLLVERGGLSWYCDPVREANRTLNIQCMEQTAEIDRLRRQWARAVPLIREVRAWREHVVVAPGSKFSIDLQKAVDRFDREETL